MKKRIVRIEDIENTELYEKKYNEEIQKIVEIPKMPKCDFFHIGATTVEKNIGHRIVDILVVVDNLHEITTFDEKRLNNIFYHRIAHDKTKGIIKYAKFTDYYKLTYDVVLYVVQRNTLTYSQFMKFDSLLKEDEFLLKNYQNFKVQYKNSEILYSEYIKEKNNFIENILKRNN